MSVMKRKSNNKLSTKGFTIIEVVLVLAIAGLIFLMVFIALPALQRSQRDVRRKKDIELLYAQLIEYRSNNSGNLPALDGTYVISGEFQDANGQKWQNFKDNYIGNSFSDPDGSEYTIAVNVCNKPPYLSNCDSSAGGIATYPISENSTFSGSNHIIHIVLKSFCRENGVVGLSDNLNKYSVQYKLEGGGIYCLDNS